MRNARVTQVQEQKYKCKMYFINIRPLIFINRAKVLCNTLHNKYHYIKSQGTPTKVKYTYITII